MITGGGSGPGNGTISFRVTANSESRSRNARIRLRNTNGTGDDRCEIVQAAGPALALVTSLVWIGTLDVSGGAGQVIVDGMTGAFQERTALQSLAAAAGAHRIEALLVTGEGRPGTWRFKMAGTFVAGTLRPIAGDVLALTADVIVFRLTGRPGERVGFAFQTAP